MRARPGTAVFRAPGAAGFRLLARVERALARADAGRAVPYEDIRARYVR